MRKKLIFDKLMLEFVNQKNVYNLEVNSDAGDWLEEMDSDCRFLKYICLKIYGVPVILNEDLEDAYYDKDVTKFERIGSLTGYCIPFEDILEEELDPIIVCDDFSADLSFVASKIDDYFEENDFASNVFYIHELEIEEQYRNNGFGSKVIQELPYLLNYHYGILTDIIAYYPAPTQRDEAPEATPYEEAMMRQASYMMNEYLGGESAASQMSKDKVVALPRRQSKEEIDELIEIEKNTPSYPEEYKNADLFRFYKKNGFEEFNQTRLLICELCLE